MRPIVILVTLLVAPAFTTLARAQTGAPVDADAADDPAISVGPTVHVSADFPDLPHYENLAAADPDHPDRLLACSTVAHQDLAAQGNHCYVSFDNGTSWSTVLEFDEGPRNSDPIMVYGRGDTVFFANEYIPGGDQNRMEIYRSADGGANWERSATFPFVDRPGIAVDETDGEYAGRIYVTGVSKGYGGTPADVVLYRSMDGGASFVGPLERPTVEGDGLLGASNTVILSDGTVAFTTFMFKKGRSPRVLDEGDLYRSGNAELKFLTSTDGGESLNPWVTVSESYLDLAASQGGMYAQLAVDPGSRFFKDRLYVVFPDLRSGRIDIRFAYSTDGGTTWSRPITVNDDRPPAGSGRGPDHMLPAIAVNESGVVLVAWYDRRDFPDNKGWTIRAAASFDGGVTFTQSTPVSDVPNVFTKRTRWIQGAPSVSGGGARRDGSGPARPISVRMSVNGFFLSGGHTSGMAVNAEGVFHPVWSDNRTGVSQLWTAPITVRGEVTRHGAAELAELEDITDKVTLEAEATAFDRATGLLTLTARLRNTSRDVVRTPVRVRLVNLRSQLGVPAVVGSANGIEREGAIWDFDGALPRGGLPPDSATAPRTLRFRLSDVRPLRLARQSGGFTRGLVNFDIRVFGRTSATATNP